MNTLEGAEHWILTERIADGARPTSCDERGLRTGWVPFEGTETERVLFCCKYYYLLPVYFVRGCAGSKSPTQRNAGGRESVEPQDSLERSKRRGMVLVRTRLVLVTLSRADGLREYSTMIYVVAARLAEREGL